MAFRGGNSCHIEGEISLIKHQDTNATVTARGKVGVLFLPRDEFQKVLDEKPDVREYLEGLTEERVKASAAAGETEEILDADDLIVL